MDIQVVKDGKFLDGPDAAKLDVILMNHCFKDARGVLTDAQKAKLLALIRGGVGVVGIHASYYSFTRWADIRKVWGATFTRHGKVDVMLTVTIVDKKHPVAEGVGDAFESHSELYQSTPLAKDCHLIAKAKEKGRDGEYPSVWTRTEGKGRVAVILPAHWPDAYKVPAFVRLIANAAKWAARAPTGSSPEQEPETKR
jgi:type 1 glutamine amidotransferase